MYIGYKENLTNYAIIPARMASTRFPGKPLAPIFGMPMLGHVAFRTSMAPSLTATYVATCDEEIAAYCDANGIKCVMTRGDHVRCADRCAEALPYIEALEGEKADGVVIVQGDEPMVHPDMIEKSLEILHYVPYAQTVNIRAPILSEEEWLSPNTIKVVTDLQGKALYFSRLPIPYGSTPLPHGEERKVWGQKQVCIMPFTRAALLRFIVLPPTPLEQAESIDMLRIIQHGDAVLTVPTEHVVQSVDCPADLERVVMLMQDDVLRPLYEKG